jgi:hypothetical protein
MIFQVVDKSSSAVEQSNVQIYLNRVVSLGQRSIKVFSAVRDESAVVLENKEKVMGRFEINSGSRKTPETKPMNLF